MYVPVLVKHTFNESLSGKKMAGAATAASTLMTAKAVNSATKKMGVRGVKGQQEADKEAKAGGAGAGEGEDKENDGMICVVSAALPVNVFLCVSSFLL